MKTIKMYLAALAGVLFFASCESDDPQYTAAHDYHNGFFVINEGNNSAGSVSFVKSDFSSVSANIFDAENPSQTGLGGYLQSVFFYENKAFIISGSNLVTVVDRYTFQFLGRIDTGFANPRFGVVANGKAYITNSNTFSFSNPATGNTDDYLAVVNLNTLQIETTINMNAIADQTLLINNKLYVSGGAFGEGNNLNIVDPASNTIVKTLTFNFPAAAPADFSPNSMAEHNGKLYVLCSNGSHAKVVAINLATNEIASSVDLPEALSGAQNLDIENDRFYFSIGKKVFSDAVDATVFSDVPLFEATDLATPYGFSVKNSAIYMTDAKDYISNGQVLVYSLSGTPLYQITAGLIPNGVYFNQ